MSRQGTGPLYLAISKREREEKVKKLEILMERCSLCPRNCQVDRIHGAAGVCGAADKVKIDSAGPHYGEEKVLVGRGGSGTIFFVHCNLNCVFCQNWTISRGVEKGETYSVEELAGVMLALQERGCRNINLVSPTPYIYQIAAAIDLAADRGMQLPVVYNSGGYESVDTLRLLHHFIDIYMPDAKFGSDRAGELYSGVKRYYSHLKEALKEMQKQVGDLAIAADGVAYRGLLVRHLVMPGGIAATGELARFLKEEISPRCAVNVMDQYYPAYRAAEYEALSRRITPAEYRAAQHAVKEAGLRLVS